VFHLVFSFVLFYSYLLVCCSLAWSGSCLIITFTTLVVLHLHFWLGDGKDIWPGNIPSQISPQSSLLGHLVQPPVTPKHNLTGYDAFNALILLVGCQEQHLAWVMRLWHGYLSGARCKWLVQLIPLHVGRSCRQPTNHAYASTCAQECPPSRRCSCSSAP